MSVFDNRLRLNQDEYREMRSRIVDFIDPILMRDDAAARELIDAILSIESSNLAALKRYTNETGHRFTLEQDLYSLIPKALRVEFKNLSLKDQLQLISLIRLTIEGVQEQKHDADYLHSLPVHFIGDILPRSSKEIEEFVVKNKNALTIDAIASIARVSTDMVSQQDRVAAVASCFDAAALEDRLVQIGITDCIIVLENRRGYVSCPETEDYFARDLANGDIGQMHITGKGGTADLRFKYTNVTIGVCVASDGPAFDVGMTYIPLGKTKELALSAKGKSLTFTESENPSQKLVFSKNRRVNVDVRNFPM